MSRQQILNLIITLSLIFLFTYAEKNFGVSSTIDSSVLTLRQEKQLIQLLREEKISQIDSVVNLYSRNYKFTGSVLVAIGGNKIYSRSFGYNNLREKEHLTSSTVYQLASVSKQFTAMAIMILKERGLLSYENTLEQYIPGFPFGDITIRQLLNHTSGLPNYIWFLDDYWNNDTVYPYNDDLIRILCEESLPRYFRPGRKFDYSNTGYAVLAYLVEKISGENFSLFLEDEIFEPLGMYNTFVLTPGSDEHMDDLLQGYTRRWNGFRVVNPTLPDGIVGDKGVFSNPEDLYIWDQALYNERLVSAETMEEAFQPAVINKKYTYPYGFGFRLKEKNNTRIVYHCGRWEGFRTAFYRYLDQRSTIIILNHTSFRAINQMTESLQRIIMESDFAYTEQIVRLACTEGIPHALEAYDKMVEQNPGIKINTSKLLEVIDYFRNINKTDLARRIQHLYFSIEG